jgi:hypothetical protein
VNYSSVRRVKFNYSFVCRVRVRVRWLTPIGPAINDGDDGVDTSSPLQETPLLLRGWRTSCCRRASGCHFSTQCLLEMKLSSFSSFGFRLENELLSISSRLKMAAPRRGGLDVGIGKHCCTTPYIEVWTRKQATPGQLTIGTQELISRSKREGEREREREREKE